MATTKDIAFVIRKEMTNALCLAGSNLFSARIELKRRYISKKKLCKLIAEQEQHLSKIESEKDKILKMLEE